MAEVFEIGKDDLPRYLAVAEEARGEPLGTVDDMLDWRSQADDMGWFLAEVEGVEAGAGLALVGWHSAPGIGRCEAYVLPAFRGRGVGTDLFRELTVWLAQRGCAEAESTVREQDRGSREWAERRGFREVGRSSRLVLELAGLDPPAVDPPDGIEVLQWSERPELDRGMYDVYREASPDIPGEEEAALPSFERWLAGDMQGSSDRPEAVFVALAGEEVVGYGKLAISLARPGVLINDLVGVKRSWRGRGIAGALKRAEIGWAKREGYTRLETENEARNEPIRRLNQRLGYVEEPGVVVYRALLASAD